MTEAKKRSRFAVVLALLAKSAKLLKLFKVAKPIVLFVSMAISVIAYTFVFGPWLALAFVVLLLLHEMGHVVALRMKGYDTPTPVFIPFIGAAIFAPKFTDRDTEAFVGYGGPVLGTVASIAMFASAFLAPEDSPARQILLVGSFLGTALNLFNLLPISPLDGGRVTQAAGRSFKYVGLFLLAVLSILWRQPVVLYIWVLVLFELTVIPIRIRGWIVALCWTSMAILMSLGYGEQHWIVNVIDCVITFPFAAMSVAQAVANEEIEQVKDDRPDLTITQRITWFSVWFLLALLLIALAVFQAGMLPHPPAH